MSWPTAVVWMTGLSCTAVVVGAVALAFILRERD